MATSCFVFTITVLSQTAMIVSIYIYIYIYRPLIRGIFRPLMRSFIYIYSILYICTMVNTIHVDRAIYHRCFMVWIKQLLGCHSIHFFSIKSFDTSCVLSCFLFARKKTHIVKSMNVPLYIYNNQYSASD